MSDTLAAILTGAVSACVVALVPVLLVILDHREKRAMRQEARDAAAKLRDIEQTGKMTHALVNSAMGVHLHLYMVALDRIALLTKLTSDVELAEVARRKWQEHEERQAAADLLKETKTPPV